LLTRRVDGSLRESRIAIDRFGLRRSRGCDRRRPLREGAPIDQERLAGLFRGNAAEPGVLHVHGRYPSRVRGRARIAPQCHIVDRFEQLPIDSLLKDLIQMRR
jgi:hypothetical protein